MEVDVAEPVQGVKPVKMLPQANLRSLQFGQIMERGRRRRSARRSKLEAWSQCGSIPDGTANARLGPKVVDPQIPDIKP